MHHLYFRLAGEEYKVEKVSFRVDKGEKVRVFSGEKPASQNYFTVNVLEVLGDDGVSKFTYSNSRSFFDNF